MCWRTKKTSIQRCPPSWHFKKYGSELDPIRFPFHCEDIDKAILEWKKRSIQQLKNTSSFQQLEKFPIKWNQIKSKTVAWTECRSIKTHTYYTKDVELFQKRVYCAFSKATEQFASIKSSNQILELKIVPHETSPIS